MTHCVTLGRSPPSAFFFSPIKRVSDTHSKGGVRQG